jgi:hypothetical protein
METTPETEYRQDHPAERLFSNSGGNLIRSRERKAGYITAWITQSGSYRGLCALTGQLPQFSAV